MDHHRVRRRWKGRHGVWRHWRHLVVFWNSGLKAGFVDLSVGEAFRPEKHPLLFHRTLANFRIEQKLDGGFDLKRKVGCQFGKTVFQMEMNLAPQKVFKIKVLFKRSYQKSPTKKVPSKKSQQKSPIKKVLSKCPKLKNRDWVVITIRHRCKAYKT